jgi:hypothetical protein
MTVGHRYDARQPRRAGLLRPEPTAGGVAATGHRELLPARPQRLAPGHAALERRDVDAEDPGRQA